MKTNRPIIVVMGVSGSGKSTVAGLLAEKLDLAFYDADHYHPKVNIDKMAVGIPLNDQDRMGWLQRLNELILKHSDMGLVLACSALKESYRTRLAQNLNKRISWIYLEGSYKEILNRMNNRKEHFMPAALLKSQFEALEVPSYAITVPINQSPESIVDLILEKLK